MLHENERSWAIEVITHINEVVAGRDLATKRAGGEKTLRGESTLFPDLLLFGDVQRNLVLQGWELKFPDTLITDAELIKNASQKAARLRLSSFVVWNAREAVLYSTDDGVFKPHYTWPAITSISSRSDVATHEAEWKALAEQMVLDIDGFIDQGEIRGQSLAAAFNHVAIADIVEKHANNVAAELQAAARARGALRNEVKQWWKERQDEYKEDTPWVPLARMCLFHWTNRILFAHFLRRHSKTARRIDEIRPGATIGDATAVFEAIKKAYNFYNVFNAHLGDDVLTSAAWHDLIALNALLMEVDLEGIPEEYASDTLAELISGPQRRSAGLFVTPLPLARLLVQLTLDNLNDPVIDPCCGTGTIVRAVLDEKMRYGQSPKDALKSTWALDKYTFPVQVATLNLCQPELVGEIIPLAQRDSLEVLPGTEMSFQHPGSGELTSLVFPTMGAVVMNPPFITSGHAPHDSPGACDVLRFEAEHLNGSPISSRRDYYTYFVSHAWRLVMKGGRVGAILSNAWLGTGYGEQFINLLQRLYRIRHVVTSGSGRWFEGPDIITTLLVLEKKDSLDDAWGPVQFSTVKEKLDAIEQVDKRNEIVARIESGKRSSSVIIHEWSQQDIQEFQSLGVPWSALFADLSWIPNVKSNLAPITKLLEVARGERRGWNPLFYPRGNHGIEANYLRPALKNMRGPRLLVQPQTDAFFCSASKEELDARRHVGALAWIQRFEKAVNNTGQPLPESLARSGLHWYEMPASAQADLALSMNPFQRLFVGRLPQRGFVDQRVIRLLAKNPSTDLDLVHLLLNSIVGMFYIEAVGFPRGLGALDLNPEKYKHGFMLDPDKLRADQVKSLKQIFHPLLQRDVKEELPNELASPDRVAFDKAVLEAFGIQEHYDAIKSSLLHLYEMRTSIER